MRIIIKDHRNNKAVITYLYAINVFLISFFRKHISLFLNVLTQRLLLYHTFELIPAINSFLTIAGFALFPMFGTYS